MRKLQCLADSVHSTTKAIVLALARARGDRGESKIESEMEENIEEKLKYSRSYIDWDCTIG